MTGVEALGVRRCRGCDRLLLKGDRCPCATRTVHVITDLGPTDLPGLVVPAQLLGRSADGSGRPYCFRMPLWYYPAQPFEEHP